MAKHYFLYGMSGAGKDTISGILKDFGYNKLRIALTLKMILCEKHDITPHELDYRKRTDPMWRDEHYNVSGMLHMGCVNHTMNRLKQLVNKTAWDFELCDPKKPNVIMDVRKKDEAEFLLQNGYHGIFLTRTGDAYKSTHKTDVPFVGDLEYYINHYRDRIIVVDNGRCIENIDSLPIYAAIKTDGTFENLQQVMEEFLYRETQIFR